MDIGCAGGIDITATRNYAQENVATDSVGCLISVKDLQGGHSGMDIHKGLGNANKIMNRLLFNGMENFDLQVAEIDGGSLRNAIPRESFAIVAVKSSNKSAFEAEFSQWGEKIKSELSVNEPDLTISLEWKEAPTKVMQKDTQEKLVRAIYTAHNGVYAMSAAIGDLVETSNNVARVAVKNGGIKIGCLTRSSVNSAKMDLANALKSAFELAGCEVSMDGEYPGWNPNPDSAILRVMERKYENLFGTKPDVVACHAGLECGILGQNYPKMDMISFGPTIKGAHSPDERVSISSVQKFWNFVQEILKDIPKK